METMALIVTLLVMMVGAVGSVLPFLPGVPITYLGFFIYGFASHWHDYGWPTMVGFGLLTAFVLVMDNVAGAMGAKKYGASRAGIIGSIVGAIAGFFFFFGIIGVIIGPLIGAVVFELLFGRTWKEAMRSGWGTFVGFVAGSLFKVMASFIMVAAFLWLVFF